MSEKLTPTVEIKEETIHDEECVIVETYWPGVDRPSTGGWIFSKKKRSVALRLARAIEAGAAYSNPAIKKDKFGQTYVHCDWNVRHRHVNPDLKRLGF